MTNILGSSLRPGLIALVLLAGFGPTCHADEGEKSEKVYITKTGAKYHRAGCSYLQSKIEITRAKAKSAGYTPCKRCRPDQGQKASRDAKPKASDGRCRAITKKGTRCKRSATSSGYCWQHG